MNIGIIILAAGESKRMGQPKQLLKVDNQSLIRRTIDIALASAARPVVLVVGANKAQIAPEIDNLPITVIDNPMWATGMASSVKMGMAGLWMMQPAIDAALILVCDQPYLSVKIIDQIIEKYQNDSPKIVASRYQNQVGVPALFDRSMFEELLNLTGDKGAKPLITKHLKDVCFINFDQGEIDLDTPEEFEQFLKNL